MKLNELYSYFELNKKEFFDKLEQCITKNNISTDNKSYPVIEQIYKNVIDNKIHERIKSTSGKLNVEVKINEY